MLIVNGSTVARALHEALWKLKIEGIFQDSRNGRVITVPRPVFLEITNPRSRLLLWPRRNANPYFHLMEVVWMMAGSDNANWISEYNSRMASYAENNVLHGAYGARWERGLQIAKVIEKLKTDPNSRQAVISMWDCFLDNQPGKGDYPCNTHIYFRINRGELDMTVCNRSNDLIWGMLGSNVVHFTMLQELIAHEIGCPMGRYQVFTNNLHIYERHWELLDHRLELDDDMAATMNPLLAPDETIVEFITDAKEMLCEKRNKTYRTRWFNEVAVPVQAAYRSHKARQPLEDTKGHIESIKDFAVARACREWMAVKYENYYGVNTYVSK